MSDSLEYLSWLFLLIGGVGDRGDPTTCSHVLWEVSALVRRKRISYPYNFSQGRKLWTLLMC